MNKHTPGPWWWEDWDTDGGPRTRSLVARPETKPTPGMFPDLPNRILCDEDGDCAPANKALIAAAPDLLSALEGLVEWANTDTRNPEGTLQRRLQEARAAIAKATEG